MNRIPSVVLWYVGIGLVLLIVQLNLGYIAVGQEQITPDVLVIFVALIAVRHGQFAGELTGFGVGLMFDLISSDILGTNALAKMLAGFIAGYFFNEQRTTLQDTAGNLRFLAIVAVSTISHNIVYYFFYTQPTELTFTNFFLRNGVAATLYTTVLSVLLMLFATRKRD